MSYGSRFLSLTLLQLRDALEQLEILAAMIKLMRIKSQRLSGNEWWIIVLVSGVRRKKTRDRDLHESLMWLLSMDVLWARFIFQLTCQSGLLLIICVGYFIFTSLLVISLFADVLIVDTIPQEGEILGDIHIGQS